MNNHDFSQSSQCQRRSQFWQAMRTAIRQVVDKDGRGKIPQFAAPYREPIWCLSSLYNGTQDDIDLANRMVSRYHDAMPDHPDHRPGLRFDIFQTNTFCDLYHEFAHLLTEGAKDVMLWHVHQATHTFAGSAQPDFVFRGLNDNMPASATCGLLMAGQILNDDQAIKHVRWNMLQLQGLLSRNAWMSEYNSPTYTALTLWAISKMVTIAHDSSIRELALKIEHRLWAEILLHYHPGTMHQAGPMSRAYHIDQAGHTHSLQLMLWYAFGTELTGRDPIASYFQPDGKEVIHFDGCYLQSAAEYCHFLNTQLHIPAELASLIQKRKYPAILRGRSESNTTFEHGAQIQTETYMQPHFSLGSANHPMCGGEQSANLFVTYSRKSPIQSFRDAATVFCKYRTDDQPIGTQSTSMDGQFASDQFMANEAWSHVLQSGPSAMMLCTPNLSLAPLESESLKLNVVFPAHFGQIDASIIGDQPVQTGATGHSEQVVPVSIAAGKVLMHIYPLLPTNLQRHAALRLSRQHEYEVLELVNYEGPCRTFTREQMGRILNGMVITIADQKEYSSLESFHQQMSAARIVDYYFFGIRFVEFHRPDVSFVVSMSSNPPGVMTQLINGMPRPMPIFESTQIGEQSLPILGERIHENFPFFPWEKMEILGMSNHWLIGSRGLPDEPPYSMRSELDRHPQGPLQQPQPIASQR